MSTICKNSVTFLPDLDAEATSGLTKAIQESRKRHGDAQYAYKFLRLVLHWKRYRSVWRLTGHQVPSLSGSYILMSVSIQCSKSKCT